MAIRGQVYRAPGPAVEYDDRTISSPVACHAFVYDAMICAQDHRLRHGKSFAPDAAVKIMNMTAASQTGRARFYYARAVDDDLYLNGFCPNVLQQLHV
jgi:hypothetical protein